MIHFGIKYGIKTVLMVLVVMTVLSAAHPVPADSKKIIIVGDSRVAEMHSLTGDAGCLWSYKVGSGYEWMVAEGVPNIDASVGENCAVVIMLGVNDVIDPFRIPMYADYINKKAAVWKERGAETFYVSILPVDDALDKDEHNADIEFWNDYIQPVLSEDVIYLDLYHTIGDNYETVDGLHYTYDTYAYIFDLVISGVDLYQSAVVKFEPQEVPPDDSEEPHMTVTAADTETGEEGGDRWVLIGGHLRYVNEEGKLATGLVVIHDYICMFDRYGDLMWQVHK